MNKDQEPTILGNVDVIYIVGNGSINNNAELLYSLRMLSANAKNVGRVVVCGDVPRFVGGRAEIVECHDVSVSGKHWNMLHKILFGIRNAKLDRPFLFSCDDHFMAGKFDLAEWPRCAKAESVYTCEEYEAKKGKPPGRYQRAFAATGELLRKNGLPDLDVVWHANMWIDPKYADDVEALAKSNASASIYGFEPILLFEAFHRRDNPDSPFVPIQSDVKAKSFDDCMSFASSRGLFSTADSAFRGGQLLNWFRKNYPDKSEYEA